MSRLKTITVVNVPFDLGAGRRGAALGPDAILNTGLIPRLTSLGHRVEPIRTVNPQNTTAGNSVNSLSGLLHLAEVAATNRELAHETAAIAASGGFPLVLGGDHSVAIGTISGLAQVHRKLGVIWFDAHSDLNTAETTPSGNIHGMSLSALLGKGHDLLTGLGGPSPKLRPEHVVLIGVRDLDPGEKALIAAEGIRCFTMHDIDRLGMAKVMEEALRVAGDRTDGLHISFDIDSVDPYEAPGTGTPVRGGLSYREAHLAMELLAESGLVTSAELVEVNPTLESDNRTAKLAAELICSLLGETIL
ncbi:arginase [Paenibacillus cremeus]|uniref:Arginase n=1 Tax=Paenibacillus cremeus TaxID=2163881 RepID=A0A559K3L0_9BACL|nr:arginase [Paenibacillus cremeus]TVY06725.1 arginase [Paenibacillus cremeus]